MSAIVISGGEEVKSSPRATNAIELCIPSTETVTVGDKTYTVYVIEGFEEAPEDAPGVPGRPAGGRRRRICVRKRFSQFADLHQVIRKALERSHTGVAAMPELPSKLQLGGGDEFIQRRRAALEAYIRSVALLPETVAASVLRSFLHSDTEHIREAVEQKSKEERAVSSSIAYLGSLGSSFTASLSGSLPKSSLINSIFGQGSLTAAAAADDDPAADDDERGAAAGDDPAAGTAPDADAAGAGAGRAAAGEDAPGSPKSPRPPPASAASAASSAAEAPAGSPLSRPAAEADADSPLKVLCHGYLFKQGRVFASWRRRYFRMIVDSSSPQLLCYYAGPSDARERGRVDLKYCTVAILDERQRPSGRGEHCFGVYTPTRALLLEAENAEEMEKWVNAFRNEDEDGQPTAQVTKDDFEILSVLGRGHFAKVMLGRKRNTGNLYAIKVIHKKRVTERKHVAHTKTERRVLGKIRHPFIVSLHFAFQTEHKLYLALDYCPGGELFGLLQRQKKVEEEHGRLYAAQIVLALEYLHRLDIIYRDLKPENVLIDGKGNLRLADFGLSKEVSDCDRTYTFCGTPEYMSPEIILDQGHGQSVDFWALGVLIYELITGRHPFYTPNKDEMYRRILSVEPVISKLLLPDSQDILRQLLEKQVHKRLGSGPAGVDEIKRHAFFRPIDFSRVLAGSVKMPFVPNVRTSTDVSNFDVQFTREVPADSIAGIDIQPSGHAKHGADVRFDSFAFFTDEDAANQQQVWYDSEDDQGQQQAGGGDAPAPGA